MTSIQSKKITCDGTAQVLSGVLGAIQAKSFQFLADSGNAANILLGGADVATNGFPLSPGAGYNTPQNNAEQFSFYQALGISFKGTVNDVLYVLYPVG